MFAGYQTRMGTLDFIQHNLGYMWNILGTRPPLGVPDGDFFRTKPRCYYNIFIYIIIVV